MNEPRSAAFSSNSSNRECNGPRDCIGTEQGCDHCAPIQKCAVCQGIPCQCLIAAKMLDEAALEFLAYDEDGNVTDRVEIVVWVDGTLNVRGTSQRLTGEI